MLTQLGDVSLSTFLGEYWQRKPLLIRQAFPGYVFPVDEHDLAGLALEPDVESRLIFEQQKGRPWQLERGPFKESRLSRLPDHGWTLLVQGLDHWVPEMADLLDEFRFLPGWRLDDIMASFAPPGGSVGPHYDHYDVFLIQAKGRRRWLVGPPCDEASPRVAGTPLRILDGFPVEQEWVLEPGDMLYLPPAFAHHGIALEDCITLSVGFRAPTTQELLGSLLGEWAEDAEGPALPRDYAALNKPSGYLDPALREDVRNLIQQRLSDDTRLNDWLGRFLTAPKSEAVVVPDDSFATWTPEALREALAEGSLTLRWNEGSRFLFSDGPSRSQTLFVDGVSHVLPGTLADFLRTLCQSNRPSPDALKAALNVDAVPTLLLELLQSGSLVAQDAAE